MVRQAKTDSEDALATSTASLAGRKFPSERVLLAGLVLLAMMAVGRVVDWHRLSIDGLDGALNDQVGYVSVARRVADHGTLESGIIYPGLLRQKVRRNTLYMPGFYLTLAAATKLFGYSDTVARIPSIVGFLLSCWLTFWIARRLYSERIALFATALFSFFPLGLVLAFTAMSEMAIVAAGLIAFAIFLRVPEDKRVWVAPLALALPIVFRETGVLLGVIMLAVLAGTTKQKRLPTVLICAVLMGVILAAALLSPIGAGRPSLWKQNILVGRNYEVLYGDAFAMDNVSSQPNDWAEAIRDKTLYNLRALTVSPAPENPLEYAAIMFLVSGVPLGFWMWHRKRDHLALGVAAALALLTLALLSMYSVWGYRGMRVLMLFLPFVAILWGDVLGQVTAFRAKWAVALATTALVLYGTFGAVHIIGAQREVDEGARENTKFLESIVQGDDQLLVAPFWLSLDFVNQHYPMRWSFVPVNCETMRLLDAGYKIGTMVVPQDETTTPVFGHDRICGLDLRLVGKTKHNEDKFWIYRREAGK